MQQTRQPELDDSPILLQLSNEDMGIGAAFYFARKHHEGQERATGEAYMWHPFEVAITVAETTTSMADVCVNLMVKIALLHDTVEDTDASYTDIISQIGEDAALGVYFMTDLVCKTKSNRDFRCLASREKLRHLPLYLQIIKCADIYRNLSTLAEHPSASFRARYLDEKKAQIQVLNGGVEIAAPLLWSKLTQLIATLDARPTD